MPIFTPTNSNLSMNKRQKMQLIIGILFAVLFVFWLFYPVWTAKIMGLLSCGLGMLSMYLSYRAEEKNKK